MLTLITKLIGSCFFVTITTFCYAQDVPVTNAPFDYKKDFKAIVEKTQDKESELAYQKLLIRFLDRDTTLSNYWLYLLAIQKIAITSLLKTCKPSKTFLI
jgi:hypothetical protein